jgi:uncharacterized membrane protein YbhN (UPF0104 family)
MNKSATSKQPAKKKPTIKRRLLSLLTYIIPLMFMYWFFFTLLPSEINVDELRSTLQGLSASNFLVLLIAGLISIVAIGWTGATVLPGLKVRKATQASVVSQLTSVILPPPADMAIRFGMYKTYDFPVDRSAVAVILSGIARYFTVVAVALLGLIALLLTGEGDTNVLMWLLIGSSIFLGALWAMKQIIVSPITARKTGQIMQGAFNIVRKPFRKKPITDFVDSAVDFGENSKGVALNHFWPIALSNLFWGFTCYLILLLATRFCGIDSSVMSAAYLLFITGAMLMLNALPLPGSGAGITETILLTNMSFPNTQVQTAFTAALILYRVYTFLLPFPIGGVAYFVWRYQIRNRYKEPKARKARA